MSKKDFTPSQEEIRARTIKNRVIAIALFFLAILALMTNRFKGSTNYFMAMVLVLFGIMFIRQSSRDKVIRALEDQKAKEAEVEDLKKLFKD